MRDYLNPTTVELMKMVDRCASTEKLLALAEKEELEIRLPNIDVPSDPSQKLPVSEAEASLTSLKEQVKEAIRDAARRQYLQRQTSRRHTPEALLHAAETCPTVDKLFALAQREKIEVPIGNYGVIPEAQEDLAAPTRQLTLEAVREQIIRAIRGEAPAQDQTPAQQTAKTSSSSEHAAPRVTAPQPKKPSPSVPFSRHTAEELLRAVEACPTIEQLFALVKREHITVQMKSFSSASNLPQKPPTLSERPPIESLREQVKAAILSEMPDRDHHTDEQLLYAVDVCPTIEQLFALVKREHITVQMKSFSSASNLPHNPPSGAMLRPDKTPLERLKEQVKAAVINGG